MFNPTRLRLAKVVKPTYRLHIGARVSAALLTYLLNLLVFQSASKNQHCSSVYEILQRISVLAQSCTINKYIDSYQHAAKNSNLEIFENGNDAFNAKK